jgi:hypothetical protein
LITALSIAKNVLSNVKLAPGMLVAALHALEQIDPFLITVYAREINSTVKKTAKIVLASVLLALDKVTIVQAVLEIIEICQTDANVLGKLSMMDSRLIANYAIASAQRVPRRLVIV